MPDNQEDESLRQFNPQFALSDLELLKIFAGSSEEVLPEEEKKLIKNLIINMLHPEQEVEDIHALGYKSMLGSLRNGGTFPEEIKLMKDDEKLLHALTVSRRDKYIQDVTNYRALGEMAIMTNDPRLIEKPGNWNFGSSQEAFEFLKRFHDLDDNNEGFRLFLGRIEYFLGLHFSKPQVMELRFMGLPVSVQEEDIIGRPSEGNSQFAITGLINWALFNQMYPVLGEERFRVLKGLDIPPGRATLLNMMDENFVNDLLADEEENIKLAQFIADYFTQLDSLPWYN